MEGVSVMKTEQSAQNTDILQAGPFYKKYLHLPLGDEQEVISTLKNHKYNLEIIQEKIKSTYLRAESLNDMLKKNAYKSQNYSDIRVQNGFKNDPMLQILIQRDKDFENEQKHIREEIEYLMLQEERIKNIFKCLRMLPNDLFDVLNSLYVKQETWDYYMVKHNLSKSTISRKRNEAINLLRNLYETTII